MNSPGVTSSRELTQRIVSAAIDALNEQLSTDQRLEKTPETVLLGRNGKLDSLGFINLIVLLEEKCFEQCGVALSLSEVDASAGANPFNTVNTLVGHIDRMIAGRV